MTVLRETIRNGLSQNCEAGSILRVPESNTFIKISYIDLREGR